MAPDGKPKGAPPADRGQGDINRSFALPWYDQNTDWLLTWAGPSRKALEFGCGVGWMTAALTSAGIDTTGIDLAAEKVQFARSQFPDCRFEVLEMTDATYRPGTFDFVVSNQVLEHVVDLEGTLAMLHRAMATGARAFFSVPNGSGLYCLLYDKIAVSCGRIGEHEQFRNLEQWCDAFARGGFRVVAVHTQNVLPYRLFPRRLQHGLAGFIHGLNRGLCALIPKGWASAFFFCLERIEDGGSSGAPIRNRP